jgi:uncharacterized Zn finger protein|tara:strand:- start:6306 stop:6560 length:255 start_codon:yes stop_codon:yes gene_type:complete
MATKILRHESVFFNEESFTPSVNIKINKVTNSYKLPVNFEEGDTVNAGTELIIKEMKLNFLEDLELINGVRDTDPKVIIEYTEI